MNKLLISIFLFTSLSVHTGLRFNENTQKFYSENASHRVDQDEYDHLAQELMDDYPYGFFYLTDSQYAAIFTMLKIIRSPASKQLMIDLKEILKELKRERNRISNL